MHLSTSLIEAAKQYGITFPAALPIYYSPPNLPHLREWAEAQLTPMLRDIAHVLVNNLRYVSFNEFLDALQQTLESFSRTINDEPYVLLVNTTTKDALENGCSDQWLVALALDNFLLKHPVMIVDSDTLVSFVQGNPHINNVLILDDAAYSGKQKGQIISSTKLGMLEKGLLERIPMLHIHIAIPFLTETAVQFICGSETSDTVNFNQIIFHKYQIMKPTVELLNPDQLQYAQNLEIEEIDDTHVLTYFDHKYADCDSAFQAIYYGVMLFQSPRALVNFLGITSEEINISKDGYNIPQIIPPYRLYNEIFAETLTENIIDGAVGKRSQYPIMDPRILAIINSTYKGECSEGYPSSALNADQQRVLDRVIMDNKIETVTYAEYVKFEAADKNRKKLKPVG